ncbi:MAG: hypothetical protein K1X87_01100 [Dehalococcoidia bacterium]|nr:hypothetical protein [Dehalococcoidia bacterium]
MPQSRFEDEDTAAADSEYDDEWPPAPPARRGDGGSFEADRNLLRVAGLIGILAAVILILVLPPISILDRGNGGTTAAPGEVVTKARKSLPALPEGIEAASAFYDIAASASNQGPATLTVRLSQQTNDGRNLAFYTYADGQWERLAAVEPADGGRAARGEVPFVPSNIAVLRRTSFARTPGLIIAPGQTPDLAAPTGGVISVLAGAPAAGGEDIEISSQLQGGLADRYLGVSSATLAQAAAVNRILADPNAIKRHVDAIVGAAQRTNAAGVHLDYTAVDPARRAAFSSLVEQLSIQLRATRRGLVVTVATPISANDTGGYDWGALAAAADALWLRPPADPALFYEQLEPALVTRRDSGFDLRKVSLVVDRHSHDHATEGTSALSLQDALATAAVLQARVDQTITPGREVTIVGANISQDEGDSGLRWDDRAKSVVFSYAERTNQHMVWLENRFSMAFRLDLARRYGLGGVTVDGAGQDDALPDVWNVVARYLEEGKVHLEYPYGPYLQPQWVATDGRIDRGASGGLAVWSAPNRTGVYDITLVVSDGVIFVGRQLSLRVAEPQREPTPTASAAASATRTAIATATATGTPR